MSRLFQETKSERMGGQRERFVRFHNDSDSTMSSPMEKNKLMKYGCYLDNNDSTSSSMSSSLKRGLERGSQGLKNIGRSLKIGVSRVVFPEDLKPTDRMIFDPQDKNLQRWNRFFVLTCIIAVAVDPLFFYVPVFDDTLKCLDLHKKLAITTTVLRSITDIFYLIHMVLQFRTAFIAPSSRVFGRGELVIDPLQIAKRYLSTYFIIDFLAVLPLPQVVIWMADQRRPTGLYELVSKNALQLVVFFQYIPRFFRLYPLISDVVKSSGVFAETAWAGAAYNLLLYMLASHESCVHFGLYLLFERIICFLNFLSNLKRNSLSKQSGMILYLFLTTASSCAYACALEWAFSVFALPTIYTYSFGTCSFTGCLTMTN